MARPSSTKHDASRRGRTLSKGGAINRESVRGTARGGNRKMETPNARPTSSMRRSGSGRRNHEDSPTRGLDPQRRSATPERRSLSASGGSSDAPRRNTSDRSKSHRKSGANGGSRFEYDERDSTDSAERTGWSGMDEETQKRPPSRETAALDRSSDRVIDNDYEETISPTAERRSSSRRSARADAGDHATPARGEKADTEAHVTGAAARGRRGNGSVDAAAGRGRAGRPRNDW